MNLPKNEKVQSFLSDLEMFDHDSFKIVIELRKIIFSTFPKVDEKMMYGGILFSINAEMFSGIFVYKNHTSLEFSGGYLMKDPHKQLEGKGKYRRHLKISALSDIADKEVAFFVKQSVD